MSCPTGSQDMDAMDATTVASMPKTEPNSVRDAAAQSPEAYEEEHVHGVYESIAGHFSSTRYKPWPFIASFLRDRVTSGSIGLDVGCGNGKYLGVREAGDVHIVGSDRSPSLVRIARGRGFEVAVADGLALPFRPRCADFVLCIAVIHHMSTKERRIDALRKLLECLREDGQVLVYVWALEQSSSRRGWDVNSEQDQLVPWVMKANQNKKDKAKSGDEEGGNADATYERFYHLYREGELEEDMRAAGGKVMESGYERDNWWVIGGRGDSSTTENS
ncbi:uracil-5--methyltransferase TRM9 [Xylaria sp. CBS 124048]|nr:uracil-5--methyltransferase TRM9 [Xylaria sp. CBS 124048]